MNTSLLETIPDTWDDERDVPFFTITSRAFTASFAEGASALLAGNDVTDELDGAESALVPVRVLVRS